MNGDIRVVREIFQRIDASMGDPLTDEGAMYYRSLLANSVPIYGNFYVLTYPLLPINRWHGQ